MLFGEKVGVVLGGVPASVVGRGRKVYPEAAECG